MLNFIVKADGVQIAAFLVQADALAFINVLLPGGAGYPAGTQISLDGQINAWTVL